MKLLDAVLGRLRLAARPATEAVPLQVTDFHNRAQIESANYREQFLQAERFAGAIGAPLESVRWLSEPVLQVDTLEVIDRLLREAGVRDLRDSAAQCLKWSAYLRPYVERAFGVRAVLTVGQLWRNQTPIFAPTWDQLHRMHDEGFTIADFGEEGTGMNIHAWLTLATGEILDFTLLSSLAAALPNSWGRLAGHALGGYPEEVFEHHRYVPMVLGDAFAVRVNNNSPVPLLAQSADDLPKLPMFVAAVANG